MYTVSCHHHYTCLYLVLKYDMYGPYQYFSQKLMLSKIYIMVSIRHDLKLKAGYDLRVRTVHNKKTALISTICAPEKWFKKT